MSLCPRSGDEMEGVSEVTEQINKDILGGCYFRRDITLSLRYVHGFNSAEANLLPDVLWRRSIA